MSTKTDIKDAAARLIDDIDEKQAEFLGEFIADLVGAAKGVLRTDTQQHVIIPHNHMQTVIDLGRYMGKENKQ